MCEHCSLWGGPCGYFSFRSGHDGSVCLLGQHPQNTQRPRDLSCPVPLKL